MHVCGSLSFPKLAVGDKGKHLFAVDGSKENAPKQCRTFLAVLQGELLYNILRTIAVVHIKVDDGNLCPGGSPADGIESTDSYIIQDTEACRVDVRPSAEAVCREAMVAAMMSRWPNNAKCVGILSFQHRIDGCDYGSRSFHDGIMRSTTSICDDARVVSI